MPNAPLADQDERKNRALELFLAGKTYQEMVKLLTAEFGRKCVISTIAHWAKEGQWHSIRNDMRAKTTLQVLDKSQNAMVAKTKEHLEAYQKVREKGEEALFGDHPLEFKKASDAVEAVDTGIQGERKVMQGIINLQFVNDVFQIILEEVKNEETLQRIAGKLRKTATLYQ